MIELGREQILAFRLERQLLTARAPASSIVDVARALCGVHAQLVSSAELALWARVEGLEQGEVRKAVEVERTLVKTWAMRGTLHLLPAEDLALYVAVLRGPWEHPQGAWLRGHGVTRAQFEAIVENVPRILDGRPRTREWLADRLGEHAGADVRERVLSGWGALLKPSARRGDLCFGPNRGRNVTFVRPDRWLRRPLHADPAEAEREVVRRFLAAYGPSSAEDFTRWLGFRGTAMKRLLRAMEGELLEVDVLGKVAWIRAEDLEVLQSAGRPRGVRLLPAFDPYVVGSRPRASLVASEHEPRVFRPQGWISPVVVVEGGIAGVWSHERRGRSVRVTVESFQELRPRARKALFDEVERLASFLGAAPELELAT